MEASKIRQEDYELIEPGMRVRIMPRLFGEELYGAEDPPSCARYLGQEVTISKKENHNFPCIFIEEEDGVAFYMEEIECIVSETEIDESDAPISVLLGN